jgi:dipeptidyl-peptidase-4
MLKLIHRAVPMAAVWAILTAFLAFPSLTHADDPEATQDDKRENADTDANKRIDLTLDDVVDDDDYWSVESVTTPKWLKDGTYLTLEDSELNDGGRDIVRHFQEAEKHEVLVRAADLIPPGEKSPLAVESYEFSDDRSKLLVYTNSKKVWRAKTRGDYWLLDISAKQVRQLGGDAPPASLMFATFAPDGERVAYVRENNLFVQDTTTFEIEGLTDDGSDTIINGTFDWVYEEEFRLRNGFRWSPDSKWIAFWRLDSSGVREFPLVRYTDGLYPEIQKVRYPKTGHTNSKCEVFIVHPGGSQKPWRAPIPGDSYENYIAGVDWSPLIEGASAPHLVISQLNREQNTLNYFSIPEPNAIAYPVHTDSDEAWIDFDYAKIWLEDGRFLWLSDRSGWSRVYVSTTAGVTTPVTPENMDVISMVEVVEGGEKPALYFTASPDNPTQSYLYQVNIDGSDPRRVTPSDKTYTGTNRYSISPDGTRALHTYSSYDAPPVSQWVKLPLHEIIEVIEDNHELVEKLAKLELPPTEFFRVKIEEDVEMDGWCIKPPDFDPENKYPVFIYVYGEPAGQTVVDRFGRGNRWFRYLAQHGYIVISMDNRGTRAPRGREWRKSVHKQIGILASADQAAGLKVLLAERSYLDPERVGIYGVSGGGSMSLNAIFRYPDLYKMAMAVSFISNQRYYDTIYQERYMGLPKDNPEGYLKGSPITYAHQLKGDLLLVYGTGDDNTHYQNCEALVDELVAHDKPFSLMVYPNRSHGLPEGRNTRRHYYGTLTRYLREKLPTGQQ